VKLDSLTWNVRPVNKTGHTFEQKSDSQKTNTTDKPPSKLYTGIQQVSRPAEATGVIITTVVMWPLW